MELNAIPAFTDVIEVTAMSARHLIEICFILTYLLTYLLESQSDICSIKCTCKKRASNLLLSKRHKSIEDTSCKYQTTADQPCKREAQAHRRNGQSTCTETSNDMHRQQLLQCRLTQSQRALDSDIVR